MDGREPSKSPNVRKAIATRIVPVEDHFVLPSSVYLIPRRHGLELIGKLGSTGILLYFEGHTARVAVHNE